mmetsp:Transcript_30985/g.92856  ORF Transcript_30985/g.92856 Transcript_30985/m.92856 type:complete len:539 (+) Transcript_30985:607-2223(+)
MMMMLVLLFGGGGLLSRVGVGVVVAGRRNHRVRILVVLLLSVRRPRIDVPGLEGRLGMTPQEGVDRHPQHARSGREENVERVGNAQLGIRTEHVIHVDGGETIPNVVHDRLDRLGQKGMSRSGGDEAVPEAHPMPDGLAGFVQRGHETDVPRNGRVEVGLQQYVHVGVHTPVDQQDAIPEQICLERSGLDGIVRLPYLGGEVGAQVLLGRLVRVESILPPRPLPGFDQAGHVGILLLRHVLEPRLMDDAGYQSRRIAAVGGRSHRHGLAHEFLRQVRLAQGVAVARAHVLAGFARRPLLVAEALGAELVGGEAVVRQQNVEEVGCVGHLSRGGFGGDLLPEGRDERCVRGRGRRRRRSGGAFLFVVVLPLVLLPELRGPVRPGQIPSGGKALVRQEGVTRQEDHLPPPALDRLAAVPAPPGTAVGRPVPLGIAQTVPDRSRELRSALLAVPAPHLQQLPPRTVTVIVNLSVLAGTQHPLPAREFRPVGVLGGMSALFRNERVQSPRNDERILPQLFGRFVHQEADHALGHVRSGMGDQ